MNTKLTLKYLIGCIIMIAPVFSFAYVAHTPVEAFIAREKQQQTFRPVNGFWQNDDGISTRAAEAYVAHASFLRLDAQEYRGFMKESNPAIVFRVPAGNGQFFDIELARYDHVTGDFKVQKVAGELVTDFAYKQGLHYSGVVAGIPGSFAAFSFFENKLYGTFSLPGGGNYMLAPNNLMPEASRAGHYILYNDADLVNKNAPSCGAELLPSLKEVSGGNMPQPVNVYNTCRDLSVYYKVDYSAYQSSGSNVNTAVDYLTYVHNVVATLYRNEEVFTSIKIVQVNTTSDPYQLLGNSSLYFLTKFGEQTKNVLNDANVAVLVSTRHGGNMGGVAWLNAMCSNYNSGNHAGPYAFANINGSTTNPFPTYTWDASMIAHEIGHLIGSPHTHSCTWPGGPIDGCVQPDDGNCTRPVPYFPSGGGTIMSYCHIGGTVSFTKGFGPLPGNLIRANIRSSKPCVSDYIVNKPLSVQSSSLTANRECTDAGGVTYYYNDNNTADKSDDRIVLKVRKNGNNIGTLDNMAFLVKTFTNAGLGSGSGMQIVLPSGTPNRTDNAVAVRRYFTFQPTSQPNSEMEFMFPLHRKDTMDLGGNVTGPFNWSDVNVYLLRNAALNPNPATGLNGLALNDLSIYTYGTTSTSSTWSLASSAADSAFFVNFRSRNLSGGAVYLNVPFPASVADALPEDAVGIYPNPTTDHWMIQLPAMSNDRPVDFVLYSTDGRVALRTQLNVGVLNQVPAVSLSPGVYFFRINGGTQVYTGTLERK